jgi:hypothetical protein
VTRSQRRQLIGILAIAFAVRLAWALVQPNSAAAIDRLPDQREYLTLAQGLLQHGSLQLFDPRFRQTLLAYRLPGYPALVAACGGAVPVVRVVQAAIDTSTVLAVFLLARQLSGGVAVGLLAATTVAINPFLVYFSGLLLSETVFIAAVVWATVAAARRAMPAAIALFIAAVYFRPTALVLAPALTFFATNCDGAPAYHWRPALLVLISLLLSLLPWTARNWVRLGVPVWTTTNDGITFYDGFHDGATGGSDQRFVGQLPSLLSMNEVDRSRDLSRRAWRWAIGHPNLLPGLSLRKAARGWSPVPLSQDFGRPLYRWVGGAYAVPFDLLCLVGLASRRLGGRAKALSLAPAVVLTAVQVITVGSIRYRMPAEPLLAVLAGAGTIDLWQKVRRRPGLSNDQDDAVAGHHSSSPL